MIIKNKDFKKLLKEKTKKEILHMYINHKINLHWKQLDKVFGLSELLKEVE